MAKKLKIILGTIVSSWRGTSPTLMTSPTLTTLGQ